ncbi:MAG TPA: BON domain-containing protein [Thermoanaerobaculia bacterium]|nr:BON domain-containing protein [Thermoanaerobaculia bacterium]
MSSSPQKVLIGPACQALLAFILTPLLAAGMTAGIAACQTTQPAHKQIDPAADAAITTKIKAKLAADGDINPFNVDVTTNQGVVTLLGRVEKEQARTKAERYARETDGVVKVIDLVKVGDPR